MARLYRDNTPHPQIHSPSFPTASPLPTFPLPCSLSPPPLLSFASTFLDIWSGRRRSAYSFYSAVHIPLPRLAIPWALTLTGLSLSPFHPQCPLLLLLDCSLRLILPWHTLGSQMKETLCVYFFFFEEQSPSQGGIVCACVCAPRPLLRKLPQGLEIEEFEGFLKEKNWVKVWFSMHSNCSQNIEG